MRQPGDRVGLTAARRMLDQIALARAVHPRIGQQPAHHGELVVAGPNLHALFLLGFGVFYLNYLRIVFEDVGQPAWGEDAFPQVIGLEPLLVRWVAGTVVPALIEGPSVPMMMRQRPAGSLPLRA